MKIIKFITLFIAIASIFTSCEAKIKNPKTETYKVWGNCGMCKKTIEKAVASKKDAKGNWDENTKMIELTYDSTKTNADAILKRIALVGYDNDKFIAPDEAYNKRPQCCQYVRKPLPIAQTQTTTTVTKENTETPPTTTTPIVEAKQETNDIKNILEKYYTIKNALVKSDSKTASASAKQLLATINAVKMENLTAQQHTVWMQVIADLKKDAEHISTMYQIEHQREHFATLSKNIYSLIKVSKQDTPTYYDHCPMYNNGKGANWLSTDKEIKNPYYGSQMLSCGSVEETIK